MTDQQEMLAPYRVLDLTSEHGHFAGKLLADLGADVIKIEPPEGDPARRRGPFVDDIPGPERSLRWLVWNTNKRSVCIDLSDSAGRDQFHRLAQSADIVLESFAPGRLDDLGLGYEALSRANPGLILVSISPFGQTGPYRDYQATDIVLWAMSGNMSITGESSGPPAHVSDDCQSYLHAGGDAAIGALIALTQRARTGRGQHVDLSIQEAASRGLYQVTGSWDMRGRELPRASRPSVGDGKLPWNWRCRDGHVMWLSPVGPGAARRLSGFLNWLSEIDEGQELRSLDWEQMDPEQLSAADWQHLRELYAEVFINRSKRELYDAAVQHDFGLFPPRDRRRHARQRATPGPRVLARRCAPAARTPHPLARPDRGRRLRRAGRDTARASARTTQRVCLRRVCRAQSRRRVKQRRCSRSAGRRGRWPGSRLPTLAGSWSDRKRSSRSPTSART